MNMMDKTYFRRAVSFLGGIMSTFEELVTSEDNVANATHLVDLMLAIAECSQRMSRDQWAVVKDLVIQGTYAALEEDSEEEV